MENNGTVKNVFDTRPEGTKKTGRPKLRWGDGVSQDIRAPGMKSWRNVVMNREDWLKLLKKARVHTGLSSQWSWLHFNLQCHFAAHSEYTDCIMLLI
jgi:hypothetical protein